MLRRCLHEGDVRSKTPTLQWTASPYKDRSPSKPADVRLEAILKPYFLASEFNNFFSTVVGPDPCFNGNSTREDSLMGPVSSMVLSPVSEAELVRIVRELKPKKSGDINGMSVWLLKRCLSTFQYHSQNCLTCRSPKASSRPL
ncbi:hypothetical protein J6590_073260 [Homalodisca vitripennis]|nr:hypothetical protein J6590_073260 [Homalodisca vitripennis]